MHRLALTLATLLVLAAPGRARAATVNVSPADGELQAALDAAQDGDVLVLRTGVYHGNFTLSDVSNVTIRGRGKVILDGDDDGDVLSISGVDGLTIEKITIRNAGDDGIDLQDSSNFTLRKCRVEHCGDSGIEDGNVQGYTVDRCSFLDCSWGLALGYDDDDTDVTVTRSRFTQISSYGIDLSAAGATIERNVLSGVTSDPESDGRGIWIRSVCTGVTVTRNQVKRMSGYGISADDNDSEIVSNKVLRCGNGIEIGGEGGHAVTSNVVTQATDVGFLVTSAGNTLTTNKASKSGTSDLSSTVAEVDNTYDRNKFGSTEFATGDQ